MLAPQNLWGRFTNSPGQLDISFSVRKRQAGRAEQPIHNISPLPPASSKCYG